VQRSVLRAGPELAAEAIADDVAELAAAARTALGEPQATISATYELRYRGQAFELAIPSPDNGPVASPHRLREAFEAAHEERYGYRDAEQEIELVTIRVSATTTAPPVAAPARAAVQEAAEGPAVLPLPESTIWVPAGWRATTLADGTIEVTRGSR
jgi:N-methylhydantoinase A/oxoprolinase/acetone carboxylase beta subunit